MLITTEALEGGTSCTGKRPPCRVCVTCEAMFTLYADCTMTRGSALKSPRLCLNSVAMSIEKVDIDHFLRIPACLLLALTLSLHLECAK